MGKESNQQEEQVVIASINAHHITIQVVLPMPMTAEKASEETGLTENSVNSHMDRGHIDAIRLGEGKRRTRLVNAPAICMEGLIQKYGGRIKWAEGLK